MRFSSRALATQKVSPVDAGCAACRTGSLNGHLSALMDQISRGDRDAFAILFDHTRDIVRSRIDSRLPDPRSVGAVFAATYVEVWWLAGCRTGRDEDVVAWINQIVGRRIADARPPSAPPERTSDEAVDFQYSRSVLELSSLLGRPADPLTPSDPGRC
ncbi:hypothetical protein AB0F72_03880 [Actinoplanes sp. NPDC023936]|uniref:hypothetical protein n=1 Tax=Actinoplanes sp. NPDC023936 TaxID=3154910 RepID=UPI0033C78CF6